MKKFDYFCIVYSVALLIFGFNDDVPKQKRTAVQAIDSTTNAEQAITVLSSEQTRRHLQYASMVRVPQKPSVQMRTFVATR